MSSLTAFASRKPAAHIKGEVFDNVVTDSATMLKMANLNNWDVRLRPIETDARATSEAYEVIRTNPFDGGIDRLGISGERYVEIQNEDAFGMFDVLAPSWECAGQFKGGAIVFGQAVSDKSIVIDPSGVADEVKQYLVISTGHGGKGALRIGRSAMRMECFNQFNLIMGKLSDAISIRHTRSAADRMKAITLVWKQNNLYFDALAEEANILYQQSVTDNQFWNIVDQFQGERPDLNTKGAQTKWDNSRELYAQSWNGQPNSKVKGTAWGVFNALIERNQWGRTIQNTANGLDNFAMAGMGFEPATNKFRQDAFEAAKSLVTV